MTIEGDQGTPSGPRTENAGPDLVHEILELVADGSSPFSVLLPELRMTYPERALAPRDVLTLLIGMQARGLVTCRTIDHKGKAVEVDERLLQQIAHEYRSGERDPDVVGQVLDRPDIWVESVQRGP